VEILDKPFILYACCEVLYHGRATSTLEQGNYLIIYKKDRSVSIHAGTLVVPRNYMGSGSKLQTNSNVLIFVRKKEEVVIKIDHVLSLTYLANWSESRIVICRTEKELARKIFDNWSDYFDDDFQMVETEFPTELGPIDLLGVTASTAYIVEVKRKRISVKDVTQLKRYLEAMEKRGRRVLGFLAGPDISTNAEKYLQKHGLNFLQVGFD
jgi:RecB family endonuclease NucS